MTLNDLFGANAQCIRQQKNGKLIIVVVSTLLLFSPISRAQKVTKFHNNTFTFKVAGFDTISIVDPLTGDETKKYIERNIPVSMNGNNILDISEIPVQEKNEINTSLEYYVLNYFEGSPAAKKLPDGVISIALDDIVINEKGLLVFYNYYAVEYKKVDDALWRVVNFDLDPLLTEFHDPSFEKQNSKPILVRSDISFKNLFISVKDHHFNYLQP